MFEGWVKSRRGLVEHFIDGRISKGEGLSLMLMMLMANPETGIWVGGSSALSNLHGRGISDRVAREHLESLAHKGYIKRFTTPGVKACYPIAINKYECAIGARSGCRLVIDGARDVGSLRYEPCEQPRGQRSGQWTPYKEETETKRRSNDPIFTEFRDFAIKSFTEARGTNPSWSAKDFAQLARLMRRHPELNLADFTARWERYLRDSDSFTAKQGHSLAYFCCRFDAYLGPKKSEPRWGGRSPSEIEAMLKEKGI